METATFPTLVKLGVVLALVAANGMFVAAEFAIVSARRARLMPLLERSKAARLVLKTVEDPNTFLAATQLGITMASLGLGWVGEPMVGGLIEPLLGAPAHPGPGCRKTRHSHRPRVWHHHHAPHRLR